MNGRISSEIKSESGGGTLVLKERRTLTTNGVLDVISFEQDGALLKTDMGTLAIDGSDLRVIMLDLDHGAITLEGKINGLYFSDNEKGRRARRVR